MDLNLLNDCMQQLSQHFGVTPEVFSAQFGTMINNTVQMLNSDDTPDNKVTQIVRSASQMCNYLSKANKQPTENQ